MKAASMDSSTHPQSLGNDRVACPALVTAVGEVLAQGLLLLSEGDEKYSVIAASPFDASIGQHYRHVIEHFQCLLEGAASCEVNYDTRPRNRRLETETAYAAAITGDVISQIERWTEFTLQKRCTTISTVGYHSNLPEVFRSNLARELAYCIGHAVHHYAIIRLLSSQVGAKLPPEFGYAPSTLKFQSSSATR